MDTAAALFEVVGALRQAQHCDGHVLQADGVAEALQRIVPAEEATLNEHDMRHQQSELVELFETASGDSPGPFWDHFPRYGRVLLHRAPSEAAAGGDAH